MCSQSRCTVDWSSKAAVSPSLTGSCNWRPGPNYLRGRRWAEATSAGGLVKPAGARGRASPTPLLLWEPLERELVGKGKVHKETLKHLFPRLKWFALIIRPTVLAKKKKKKKIVIYTSSYIHGMVSRISLNTHTHARINTYIHTERSFHSNC